MILLDTNVVSDSTRSRPHPSVRSWLSAQRSSELFICSPVLAELRYGIERLPAGAKRAYLEQWLHEIEGVGFAHRVLPFDAHAAHEFGRLLHRRMSKGRPIQTMDAIIAAIAKAEGATLATRDVGDFADLEIDVVNPFEFRK